MNTDKIWFALEITVASEASEAVESALNELDALGTEINNLGVKQAETLCVIGYFNKLPDDENTRNKLSEALRIYEFAPTAIRRIDKREVEDTDWLAEWKKHWKPTETAKFTIAPSWEKIEEADKIIIRIEPNMAFGTGTHETTRLCLKAIEENFQSDMSFLDVGTGTGILAIAAAKFQVSGFKFQVDEFQLTEKRKAENGNSFLACDTDANSIKIAEENAELNEVGGINFYVGSISGDTAPFDFVCANLTVDVILPILSLLIEKTEKILILSGILKEQENLIISELGKFQITNYKIETDGEWIAVLIKR